MQVANDQIIGSRKEQQDYFAIPEIPKGLLTIVADGMGGYKGGAVASSEAVKQFIRTVRENFNENSVPLMLEQALRAANKRIAEIKKQNSQLDSMGTTFLATLFIHDRIYWISVGDSILFRWRNGNLERLNEIHSMAERVDKEAALGIISNREAAENPQRHAITSGLTGKEIPMIDVPKIGLDIIKGDRFLLASDGLLTLSVSEIEKTIQANSQANQLTQKLLTAVSQKNAPNQDNCTVISIFADNEMTGVFAPFRGKSKIKLNKMANLLLIPLALVVLALAYFFLPIDPLGIKTPEVPKTPTLPAVEKPVVTTTPEDSAAKANAEKEAMTKKEPKTEKPAVEKKKKPSDGRKTNKPTSAVTPATDTGANARPQAGPAPTEGAEASEPAGQTLPEGGQQNLVLPNPNEADAAAQGGTTQSGTPESSQQNAAPTNQKQTDTTQPGGTVKADTSKVGQQKTPSNNQNSSGTTPQGGTGTSATGQQGTSTDNKNESGTKPQGGTGQTGSSESGQNPPPTTPPPE